MCDEKINLTDKYTTRDGRPVRVLCLDRKGQYPVVALVTNQDGGETAVSYTATGGYWSCREDNADLIKHDPLAKFRNLPVDTPVWVKDTDGLQPRHFAYVKGNRVHTFVYGTTSHSHSGTSTANWSPEDVFLTKPQGT